MRRALVLLLLQPSGIDRLIQDVIASGRVVSLAQTPSERLAEPPGVAPGQPPLLSFRYLEGKQRGRFANIDLVLDDAGH